MIKPDENYESAGYLYNKFSNEPYVPRAKWNTSTEFVPDPVLTSSEYKNDVVPVDTTSQDHSRS